jgi:DNA ligase-1
VLRQGKIGVGWGIVDQAMAESFVAGSSVTLLDVDRTFAEITSEQGPGSADRKRQALGRLFARASSSERRYLADLLLGGLRQGALEGLAMEAIAKAAALPAADIRQAVMFSDDIGAVARAALEEGAHGLTRFSLRLCAPVAPMLANSAEDVDEALSRLGSAAFEYKLDGARIQVHKQGQEVRVFTRQLQDVTVRVPDIVELAREWPVREVVLEGEAIALRSDGRPQPFQITMRRFGRTRNVTAIREVIPLSAFFFDCLYLNDEGSLIGRSYRQRMECLADILPGSLLIPRIVTADVEEAHPFFRRAIDEGHEGLMAKSLTAPYMAGQRGSYWLKVKAAITLDLVILAAEWGHGRRKGWLSNLHLGARDPQSHQWIMLGKTFKGLTDAMLRWQTEALLLRETHREGATVYVKPDLVVEIAFNDIQESPRYPAGLALRFARVKRYRPDKPAEEADTIQTVRDLFHRSRS